MAHGEKFVPFEINFDDAPLYLKNEQARLIKNLDHHGADAEGRGGVLVGLPATEAAAPGLTLPPGTNTLAGTYTAPAGEVYVWVHNSTGAHTLYRLVAGRAEVLFEGPELDLSPDPERFISEGRAYLRAVQRGAFTRSFLLWTDGATPQRLLCVEDALATRGFTHTFFAAADRRALTYLGVPTPLSCIGLKPVASPDQKTINHLKRHAWRFRLCTVDVYGRKSEHGIISDWYYQDDCYSENITCLDLSFSGLDVLVDKVMVEYQQSGSSEWAVCQTLDLYQGPAEGAWWTRGRNPELPYAAGTYTYRFCGPGECRPVPDVESARVENPLPLVSESLFPLAGGIGLAGNRYGFGPFAPELLRKMSFSVEKPTAPSPATETRSITVWATVVNAFNGVGQAIWQYDGNTVFGGIGPKSDSGVAIAGGMLVLGPLGAIAADELMDKLTLDEAVAGEFHQVLPHGQEGFIGYLAGTQIAAISRQYQSVWSGGRVSGWKDRGVVDAPTEVVRNKWLQKFEFHGVPPGRYLFRLAGHEARLSDPGYQRTSTQLKGTGKRADGSTTDINLDVRAVDESRELFIDVCAGDYDSLQDNKILHIWDLTWPENDLTFERNARVVTGYVCEDMDGEERVLPIEGAKIDEGSASIVRRVWTTDHNGFYFMAARDASFVVNAGVQRGCGFQMMDKFRVELRRGRTTHDFVATQKWPDYLEEKGNRVRVRGRVVDCATSAGVPNVVVGVERGQFVRSAADGSFDLIVRDREGGFQAKVLLLSGGACRLASCSGALCLPTFDYHQPDCSDQERVVAAGTLQVLLTGAAQRGLQKGGRYALAINGSDWMGRQNFAQALPSWYVDIPTDNQSGTFAYPRLRWQLDPSARFPLWMKRLHLRISRNLAFSDLLSWVCDRVELIDNTGLENKVAPTQVRVYYSSLNEYNKQLGFATNATWQFIDEKDALAQEVRDTVHFVANGDGKLFPTTITAPVRFDRDGRYFLVDYSPELSGLKEGALIRLLRARACKNSELLFELCRTIEVRNGVAQETSGYLDAYDSFVVQRQIPTPVTTTKKVKKAVAGSSPVTYEEVEESETQNVIKPYSWPFEHTAPSDLWGEGVAAGGRPLFKNPLEAVQHRPTEIALSGALGEDGIVNYLHYLDDGRKKIFSEGTWEAITAVVPQQNVLLVVCRSGYFLVPFDDNAVRARSDGQVVLVTGDQQFGKPQSGPARFGLDPRDRRTLCYHRGRALWVDRARAALVLSNFQGADDIAEVGRYATYLSRKLAQLTAGRYLHAGISPKDGQYYLTDFDGAFVNTRTAVDWTRGDTLAVDLQSGRARKLCSFTPEGFIGAELGGGQLFSFCHGVPFAHHHPNPQVVNTFYGTKVPRVVRLALGADPLRVKQFLGVEVYAPGFPWWAPEVVTESGQRSRLPRNWMVRGEKYWAGAFLCAENTPEDPAVPALNGRALTAGDTLRGRWLEVTFTGDPDHLDTPEELTGIILYANDTQTTNNP